MDGLKSKAILALITILDWLTWALTRAAGKCATWALSLRPQVTRGLKTEIEWVVELTVMDSRAVARIWGVSDESHR